VKWYKERARRKVEDRIAVQRVRVALLEKAASEYGNSYYTDKLIDAKCALEKMRRVISI